MFTNSDAWVLLAIVYNHKAGGSDLQKIIATADGINHAVLTFEELGGGLTRLINAGLVVEQDHRYLVTAPVLAAYAKTHSTRGPVQRDLKNMVKFLDAYHGQEQQKILGSSSERPHITQDSYERAIKSYIGESQGG